MRHGFAIFLKVILSFILLTSYVCLKAGSHQLDQLIGDLDTTSSAESQASILNELAWQMRNSDPLAAQDYAKKALKISRENGLLKESTYSLNRLASYQLSQGNFLKAEAFYQEVLNIRQEIGDSLLIGGAYNNLGNLYRRKGDQLQAFENYSQAKTFLQMKSGERDLSRVWTSIGLLHQKSGNFTAALEAFQKALSIRQEHSFKEGLADSYLVLGGLHQQLQRYDLAREYYYKAEVTYGEQNLQGKAKVWNNLGNAYYLNNKSDSAMLYYSKALETFQDLNNVYESARILNNLGQVYAAQGNEKMAEYYTILALKEWEAIDAQQGITESLLNLGLLYAQSETRLDTAKTYLERSLTLSRQRHFPLLELEALKALSVLEENNNGIEQAFPYLKAYLQLNDSLNFNYQQSINLQFQLEKERRERIEESAKNERLEVENEHQTALIIGGSIIFFLLLMISIAIAVIFRQKKKKAELEKERKEQELLSVQSILETQDRERKRIARDLHDRLGSMLSWIKITFQSSEEKIEQLKLENRQSYQEAVKKLDEAVELTREIAQNLDSGVLKKFGLVPAIKELIQSIEKSVGLNIEFEHSALKERLVPSTEEALYRIIQEVLNNVLKHAQAKEVTIQITRNNGNLNLLIEDNGTGFDVKTVLKNESGMGLKNIRSRLQPLKGSIEFDSRQGRGTIVIINLPIKKRND